MELVEPRLGAGTFFLHPEVCFVNHVLFSLPKPGGEVFLLCWVWHLEMEAENREQFQDQPGAQE